MTEDANDPDPLVVIAALGRVLRTAGVTADAERIAACTEAVAHLDPTRRDDVYWAGRLTLCSDPDDLPRYDAAFNAVFHALRLPTVALGEQQQAPQVLPAQAAGSEGLPDTGDGQRERIRASASAIEVLRARDIAELTGPDRADLARLLTAFTLPGELRPSRRRRHAGHGLVDRRRTVRGAVASGGEVFRLHHQQPRRRPRRVVLLVDVSGSMAAYADALLRFAHAARRGAAPIEVFTLGTRLTRVTRELSHRDPEVALRAVAAAVPDWSGGTRLGDLVRAFLDTWGQRGMARGAVVVVMSDGWERGDAQLLGDQMQRLHRLAHRVIWANPRRGKPGYAPLVAGMAAAMPHVDDFVSGHSIEALEHLAAVVAGRREPTTRETVHA